MVDKEREERGEGKGREGEKEKGQKDVSVCESYASYNSEISQRLL